MFKVTKQNRNSNAGLSELQLNSLSMKPHTLRHSLIVYTALCYHYLFKYLSLPLKGCSSKTGKVTPSLHPSNTQQGLLYNDLKVLLNIQFMVLQHYFPLTSLLQPNLYKAIFTAMGKHNSLEYRLCIQID